ncbi:gluconokinase [Kocuria sp.]|uniref:gluconokinase n=1 Tax=Kocuria sp. TaxID=1871328 RepID=UPI0026DC38F8|nr:gluconokinase [Kocuria sp.]MDO4919834.1 gluconokinase [Kocuria sp.]
MTTAEAAGDHSPLAHRTDTQRTGVEGPGNARGVASPLVVVMGVSGSGKTTIGTLVAHELGVEFLDGDSLHPIENVEKMAAGTPLEDEDRWPWLETVGRRLHEHGERGEGLVIACSALKRVYRERIRSQAPSALFLHLDGTLEVLTRRIEGRSGHFMPASLLASQIATLEPLEQAEGGYVLNIDQPVADMVREAVGRLRAITAAQL